MKGCDVQNLTTVIINVECDVGAFGQESFYTTDFEKKEKSLWKYNYIFLKMFFLTSGFIIYHIIHNCDVLQNNKF